MVMKVLMGLLPVVLLILLGMLLRHRRFLADEFWPQGERLAYYVLVPSLFFHGLSTAHLQSLPVASLAGTLIGSILGVAGLAIALRPWLKVDGPAFTSIFQGSIRFNNYVGVTLAAGLFGAKGIALAALCNAATVPTVNILCVLVFARHGEIPLSRRGIARQLVSNPLVVSSLAGILFQMLGLGLPMGIEPALGALGSASLPLGLLCAGAALDFSKAGAWVGPVLSSSLLKFGAMPAFTLLAAWALGLHGPALVIAMLFQSLPTASSAYVMARQLGGDAPLMAGIAAMQTAVALATLPVALIAIMGLA